MEFRDASQHNNKNGEAFRRALLLLKNHGSVGYDKIYTDAKEANNSFARVIGGQLLNASGNEFFWKRPVGKDMTLYARNEVHEELKDLGLVEILRFREIPDEFVGAGTFVIDWPDRGKDVKESLLLVTLYLYSPDSTDFGQLTAGDDEPISAFLACLFLDEENANDFYELAKERFDSLR
jgi:hypothetical protein